MKKKNDPSFSFAVTHSLALYGHRVISDPKLSQKEEKLITHFITPPSSCLHTQPALFLSQPTQPSETHESECLHPTLEIRVWAERHVSSLALLLNLSYVSRQKWRQDSCLPNVKVEKHFLLAKI
ncbi:hypothetical protein ROHU_022049 [Labeo rohita]|uniref:Uncharacterized protein n=1 Tax=Labeo rohita TaxID=84645 RepID=A0A498MYY2_LABRO|nr:hypothetical protein ROHU_022049 [Labeo rohita]